MKHCHSKDFRLIKKMHIFESVQVQSETEFLNTFNKHVFVAPDTALHSPTFGIVSGTVVSTSAVQFTLRIKF